MKIKILIFISVFFSLMLVGSVYANEGQVNHHHQSHISPFDGDLDKKKVHCLLNNHHHLLHCLLKKGSKKTPSLQTHCGDSPFPQGAQTTSFQKSFSQVFFENPNLPKPLEVFQNFASGFESYRFLLGTPPIPPPRLV
jgi:hypothetical protein